MAEVKTFINYSKYCETKLMPWSAIDHLPGPLTVSPIIYCWLSVCKNDNIFCLHAKAVFLLLVSAYWGSFRNTSGQHTPNGSYTYTDSEVVLALP